MPQSTTDPTETMQPIDDFHQLLALAADENAREVFLIPGEPPALRLPTGAIHRLDRAPLDDNWLAAVSDVVIGDDVTKVGEELGEVTRWYDLPGVVSARCTLARSAGRLTLVVSRVPAVIPTVQRIGLPDAIVHAVESGWGLVIFGGMSGSGKTTSAFSIIEHMNAHHPWHICTVEDPIEARFEAKQSLLQQRQVGFDVPTRMAGIRAAMRQDLDLLFVGDIKNVEEMQACLNVAAAGHMVLTQIGAGSVQEVIQRIVDAFPLEMRETGRRSLAQVLRAVCVQRLLPRRQGDEDRGRLAAYEVLMVDDDCRAMIAGGLDPMNRSEPPPGQLTMLEALEDLRAAGDISDETFERAKKVNRGRMLPL